MKVDRDVEYKRKLVVIVSALFLIVIILGACGQEKKTDYTSQINEINKIIADADAQLLAYKFDVATKNYNRALSECDALKKHLSNGDPAWKTLEMMTSEINGKIEKISAAKQRYEAKVASENKPAARPKTKPQTKPKTKAEAKVKIKSGIVSGGKQEINEEAKPEEKQENEVTAKKSATDGRFIDNRNGTITDTKTDLMWAAKDNGRDINWADAKSYCHNYRGGGYSDWRMPTQDELAGLYDKAKTYKPDCEYDVHLTDLIHLTCNCLWASETDTFGSQATSVNFYIGLRYWYHQSSDSGYRVLPVRSAK